MDRPPAHSAAPVNENIRTFPAIFSRAGVAYGLYRQDLTTRPCPVGVYRPGERCFIGMLFDLSQEAHTVVGIYEL